MRVIKKEYQVYNFNELDEATQVKAVEKLWDINIDHDWWDGTACDIDYIGCGLIGFDIDRGSYCELDFSKVHLIEIARLIIDNHGKHCRTYELASNYIKHYEDAASKEDTENSLILFERSQLDSLQRKEFIDGLQEEYLSILRKEYEYLTSFEAIVETIQANEFEFTENGDLH